MSGTGVRDDDLSEGWCLLYSLSRGDHVPRPPVHDTYTF